MVHYMSVNIAYCADMEDIKFRKKKKKRTKKRRGNKRDTAGTKRRLETTEVLTLRLLMSYIYIYIYGAPILDVSRSHTTTHHSR